MQKVKKLSSCQVFELLFYLLDYLGRSTESENGLKKQELSKNPKYIEMRMDELYPVKKARPWMRSGKENSKVHDRSDPNSWFL